MYGAPQEIAKKIESINTVFSEINEVFDLFLSSTRIVLQSAIQGFSIFAAPSKESQTKSALVVTIFLLSLAILSWSHAAKPQKPFVASKGSWVYGQPVLWPHVKVLQPCWSLQLNAHHQSNPEASGKSWKDPAFWFPSWFPALPVSWVARTPIRSCSTFLCRPVPVTKIGSPKKEQPINESTPHTITPCGQESTWSTTSHGFIDSSVEELWTLARIEMSVKPMPASLSQWAAEPSLEEEILLQTSAQALQLS